MPNEKIVATIEVRMGSTRFPGKSLKPILGKPMLERLIERIKFSKRIHEVVVATSINPDNDPIEVLAKRMEVGCYRGSEEDVLDRVLKTARSYQADVIVELWGDNPLMDPKLIDESIDFFYSQNLDCTGTTLKSNFPYGLSCLVFRRCTLEEVDAITKEPADRENVSNYIYEHPEKYKVAPLPCPPELARRSDIRLTVDREPDFEVIQAVFEGLHKKNQNFSARDIIEWLDQNPQIKNKNAEVQQKTLADCRLEHSKSPS